MTGPASRPASEYDYAQNDAASRLRGVTTKKAMPIRSRHPDRPGMSPVPATFHTAWPTGEDRQAGHPGQQPAQTAPSPQRAAGLQPGDVFRRIAGRPQNGLVVLTGAVARCLANGEFVVRQFERRRELGQPSPR